MSSNLYVFIIFVIFCVFFIFKERKFRKHLLRSNKIISLIMDKETSESIIIDLDFESGIGVINSMSEPPNVMVIGDNYKKGYDFLVVTQKANGAVFPQHTHNVSSEFFYIVSGKISILFLDKDPVTLSSGDAFYVKNKTSHSVFAEEDSQYIIIAKPSILKRVGKFYERFF